MADGASLTPLSSEECAALLGTESVGRLAFLVDGAPMIVPVNYRFVPRVGPDWILIRTRDGGMISSAPSPVAFEIDGTDANNHSGWSVVARGTLHHLDEGEVEPLRDLDPHPWVPERHQWLVVKCSAITGRRLGGADEEWPFHSAGYL